MQEKLSKLTKAFEEQQQKMEKLQSDMVHAQANETKIKFLEDQLVSFRNANQAELAVRQHPRDPHLRPPVA